MTALREGIALLLLAAGSAFYVAGTIGLLRFPDLRCRLHALAKADNLGLGLVLAGLSVYVWSAPVAAKWALTWVLALLAAATSSQLLARTVRHPGVARERSPE